MDVAEKAECVALVQYAEAEPAVPGTHANLSFIDTGEAANLKRNYTTVSILAVAFDITNSWVGVAVSFPIAVALGGTVTLLYGVILVSVMFLANGLTLAELASVYPTAGGQYHFTSILAPEAWSRPLSYSCGLLAALSWIATTASVTIIIAQMIFALAIQFNSAYVPENWHYFLLYQGINVFIMIYNMFLTKRTTFVYRIGFALTLTLFLVIFTTSLARAEPKQSSANVWLTFTNNSGWPNAISFLTGTATPQFMFVGLDASLHLAEECLNAATVVPRAVMGAVGIGFLTAFVFSIAMCYCISDLESVLATPTGLPIYEAWMQATRSVTAGTVLLVFVLISGFIGLNAMQQTSSRMTWSFARDNALLCSNHLAKVHPKWHVPIQSLIVNAVIVAVIGCLYVASTTAFYAFIATCAVLQQLSFAMPAALLLYRRRVESVLPRQRPFYVPQAVGFTANVVVCLWTVVVSVFLLFPASRPVTSSNMNYAAVVLGIMGVCGALNWFFYARKRYAGPRIVF